MNFLLQVLINALALWGTTELYHGVFFQPGAGMLAVLWAGLVLGVVNALVRPLILLLTLPLNALTLGLFTLVINGLMLYVVTLFSRLAVSSFGAAVVGALILTIVNWVLNLLFKDSRQR
ncbi:putative membrane protein [Deinobacterium chartae]|uniref:Putative membrane protein n=1 Tax=Deinobacterium chartae TaxID=521158 RepID=A0A841HXS3_9DEIO|nr:phage holin family protein [Deinobacterium chartae]MBB6097029.1 putative membrane protein [Deinobacterium chartae]